MFFSGERIEISPNGFNALSNFSYRASFRALEDHMLNEVGNAVG